MGVELDKEAKEEHRKLSTSELAKRLSESSHRLEAGAEYSDDEIEGAQKRAQTLVQTRRDPDFYPYDRARNDLMITDLLEQQASAQTLEERKKEG